jgi:hypothetical protein
MKKNSIGSYLLKGLKIFAVTFVTGLFMIIPVWFAKWLITAQQLFAVGVILLVFLVLAHLVISGWLATKFWNWK